MRVRTTTCPPAQSKSSPLMDGGAVASGGDVYLLVATLSRCLLLVSLIISLNRPEGPKPGSPRVSRDEPF